MSLLLMLDSEQYFRLCSALSCRIENPSQDAAGKATMIVNEDAGIVTVQAGVPQRDLLDYLANYS